MATTTTAKLGLLVDPLGESPISVQKPQWLKVDKSAGVLSTIKGVDIPNADLYPGALVAEKDTGISWRCLSDGSGGYTKKYMNYPYSYCAYHNGNINHNTETAWGWSVIYTPMCVNSGEESRNPVWNSWKAPIKALYSIEMHITWNALPSNCVVRQSWTLNNTLVTNDYNNLSVCKVGNGMGQTTVLQLLLNAGDEIRPDYWHNAGATVGEYNICYINLVRPVN
jgi:hypothetical protein